MSVTDGFRPVEEMIGTELDEVSGVDEPATDRPFLLFKCVSGVGTTSNDTVPRGTRGRSAPATKEGTMPEMPGVLGAPVTPEGAPEPPLLPEEDSMADVLEIPAAPSPWTFADCIRDAQGAGMDENTAIASCQIIRSDFGDPEHPDVILVPQGSSTEGMLASAAVHGGIGVPAGLAGKVDKSLKFSKPTDPPRSHWLKLWDRFIGKERPAPPASPAVEALRKEMATMQAKTSEDLREILAENRRLLHLVARLGGVDVGEEDDDGEPAPIAAPAAIPPAPAPAFVDPGKSAAKTTTDERLDRIEALIASLKPETDEEGLPAAVPAPPDLTVVGKGADNHFRRSRDPRRPGSKATGDRRPSSILGGALVSAADRKALGWKHGC